MIRILIASLALGALACRPEAAQCCDQGKNYCYQVNAQLRSEGSTLLICCPADAPHYCDTGAPGCYRYFTDAQAACGSSYEICGCEQ